MFHVNRTKGISLFALIVLLLSAVAWQPRTTHAAGGGWASWSDGGHASRTTSYYYIVTGGPSNLCGEAFLSRNGVPDRTGFGWICTDSNGNARKGPWTPTQDETAQGIYTRWEDGSTTHGGSTHINDVTTPFIRSYQSGGYGVPISTAYNGTASDAKWGTGFDFGFQGWTSLWVTYQNVTTGKYYGIGPGYDQTTKVLHGAQLSPCCYGFNLTWSATPPPPSAHNSTDTYKWCVSINDFFYTGTDCITFTGPRS